MISPFEKIVKNILKWENSDLNKFIWRKPTASKFLKINAEILLKRTRAERVNIFLLDFVKNYQRFEDLSGYSADQLYKVFKNLGLGRQRAHEYFNFLTFLKTNYGFKIPKNTTTLYGAPAIGKKYTFSAISTFTYSKLTPLIDSNTIRIVKRYFKISEEKVDLRMQKNITDKINEIFKVAEKIDIGDQKKFGYSFIDLGRTVCKPIKPICESCPLNNGCSWANLFLRSPSRS